MGKKTSTGRGESAQGGHAIGDLRASEQGKPVSVAGESLSNRTEFLSVNATEAHDWKQLDALPMLKWLHVLGKAEGLLEYCAGRPLLKGLSWSDMGATTLDFSATHLEKLTVHLPGVEKIILGDTVETLSLSGDPKFLHELRVEQPGLQGRFCKLVLSLRQEHPVPRYELPLLRELSITCDECDLARVAAAYPQLRSFTANGNPGTLRNLAAMKELPQLDHLALKDMFGFSAAEFPSPEAMPALDSLLLTSVPQEVGQWVKRAYGHFSEVKITKLRTQEWVELNADNPFRSWDGRDNILPAHAKRAFTLYKQLKATLQALQPLKEPTEPFLKAVEDFVTAFNKMGSRSSLETEEREEIGEVLEGLLRPLPVSVREAAMEIFDTIRDF